ncbi:MAG: acryloyl-CoA reductase [Steroidobacteraceae bacterium]
MSSFPALRIHRQGDGVAARLEELQLADLNPGAVLVRVSHSSINYKDALAASGAGRILRRFPLVGGIDLAGVVESSEDPAWQPGQAVVVTGCGLSETRDGGYARYARLPAEALIALPDHYTAEQSMIVGTAGFAAALGIVRMEHNGLQPDAGPVVVSGASGGVGALAIDMLAARGYRVIAVSRKPEQSDWLQSLGASEVVTPEAIIGSGGALQSARFAGAIDNVGGPLLGALLASMQPLGSVASVGLAGSAQLQATVMPFILRGVNLLGVNSSGTGRPLRLEVWRRLAGDLRPRHFDRILQRRVPLGALLPVFNDFLAGKVRGRTIVEVGS